MPLMRIRWPMARRPDALDWSDQYLSAAVSLTTTAFDVRAPSVASKTRPAMRVTPTVAKKSRDTIAGTAK
jgi:hypothetical protein